MVLQVSDFADSIHAEKYRQPGETFEGAMDRISQALSDDFLYEIELNRILRDRRFLPGGRIQAGAGTSKQVTLQNCYVSSTINDSLVDGPDCIMDVLKQAATTMRMGGGIGYDFSSLRPERDLVERLKASSSGPLSFMQIFDTMCKTIASAGNRRGAQMGVMRVDHPDIIKFIKAKHNNTVLTQFNLSVALTEKFMRAVGADEDFDLVFKGKVYSTLKARDLWDLIMESTYDYAEPGVLFIDTINKTNNLYYCETIAATNPCFAPGTLIITKEGAKPIEDLVGKVVDVWDGTEWKTIDNFRITGRNQKVLDIKLYDGSNLQVTPAHTMYLEDGTKTTAGDLKVGDKLQLSDVLYEGSIEVKAAYLKGFLCGDGSLKKDNPSLQLYGDKSICKPRLEQSALELPIGVLNTNVVTELDWRHDVTVRQERDTLKGLTARKEELVDWCGVNKASLPSEIYSWTHKSKTDFLAGLFDADGTASDTSNGFMYQLSSIYVEFLKNVQTLLKSIGVQSKIALMYEQGWKEIAGGMAYSAPCWRLTVSQKSSVKLSSQVNFERLTSFADKTLAYNVKSKRGEVVYILDGGMEEVVYCCTVPDTHKVTTAIGVTTGQCGEQPLPPNGACLLGSFNLTRYVVKGWFDYDQFTADIHQVVRAMDNVIDISLYPLDAQRDEQHNKRRIGIGVTGLANAVEAMLGKPSYGDPEFIEIQHEIMRTLRDECYRASIQLAKEKGSFPLFDEQYLDSLFIRGLPKDIRDDIAKYGIRNSHLLSIAPTGTISITADNISSGIEPVFSYITDRKVKAPEGEKTVTVKDFGYANFDMRGRRTQDVTIEQHLAVLEATVPYIDSAVSKTCNVPTDISFDDFKNVYWQAWLQGNKGCTTFRLGGKRFGILESKDEKMDGGACVINADGTRTCDE